MTRPLPASQLKRKRPVRDGASTYEQTYVAAENDGSARFNAPAIDTKFQTRIDTKTKAQREALAAQPLVAVYLPERSSSGDTRPVHVQIGQLKWELTRGIQLRIPEQIAALVLAADVF